MVVAVPPIRVAIPTGIRTREVGTPLFSATVIRIGMSTTMIGVLLTKALMAAATSKVRNSETNGLQSHSRPSQRPSDSRAPVRINPCPTIIKAQTAISAS